MGRASYVREARGADLGGLSRLPVVSCSEHAAREAGRILAGLPADREHLLILLLDTRNRLIGWRVVCTGGLCGVMVTPREIFRDVLRAPEPAAAIVLAHNHPSGDPAPSHADREMTRRCAQAGEVLGLSVLDHVIVASDGWASVVG